MSRVKHAFCPVHWPLSSTCVWYFYISVTTAKVNALILLPVYLLIQCGKWISYDNHVCLFSESKKNQKRNRFNDQYFANGLVLSLNLYNCLQLLRRCITSRLLALYTRFVQSSTCVWNGYIRKGRGQGGIFSCYIAICDATRHVNNYARVVCLFCCIFLMGVNSSWLMPIII